MADSFLVLVPHKTLHGTISILIQRPKLATNVRKMGAVKNKMPFIPRKSRALQEHVPLITQSSSVTEPTHTPVARQARMAALLNWQQMRPHAKSQNPLQLCSGVIRQVAVEKWHTAF